MNDTHTDFSIQRWLEELPDSEIEREMAELDTQIQALSARINTLRGALELKQRFRNLYGQPVLTGPLANIEAPATVGGSVGPTGSDEQEPPRPSSISKSVLLLMESVPDKREWTVGDLSEALVERGWLSRSTQAQRSLGAALSRMTTDGEIRRVSRGRYARVGSESASPSLLDEEGDASG